MLLTLLWSLWYERNKFTHGGRLKNAGSLLEDIGQWLHIYQQAQINKPPVLAPSSSLLQSWKAPDPGCLKLNVDALVREGSPTVGLGAIIREESGFVLGAMAKPIPGCFSPFVTECLALREWLIFAADSGLQVQKIETNAFKVVNSLQKIDPLAPEFLIIEDISLLLGELSGRFVLCHSPISE
ncbi:hypothetical protein TIFTF001_019407 [Ficus carica]|uniref:RNase H type-1 domain-containing protein n=1 Tax=Ficus carica TaxID=3494 RepID=A0AA88A6F6_FICCA|nr:hypothetical protein TIFTF001_019407 [Ficus carica]